MYDLIVSLHVSLSPYLKQGLHLVSLLSLIIQMSLPEFHISINYIIKGKRFLHLETCFFNPTFSSLKRVQVERAAAVFQGTS